MGCALPEGATGAQHRAADRAARRLPGHRSRRDGQPLLLVRTADDRDRGAADHRGRRRRLRRGRRRVDLLRAERAEPAHAARAVARRAQARDLLADAARPPRRSRKRYGISRERQDEYGVRSQQRAAAAAAAGRFADEIVPMTVTMGVADKDTGALFTKEVTIAADEGIRADTTYEASRRSSPRCRAASIAAGNASQFSDGAAACVVMSDAAAAAKRACAARHLPRLRRRRLRARRDGHRPGVRRAQAARSARA